MIILEILELDLISETWKNLCYELGAKQNDGGLRWALVGGK